MTSFISWDALNGARLPRLRAEAPFVPDSLGSSLAEEIEHLASDVRVVPREAATQRARTAPVKMLFLLPSRMN
jgi:hypothetical protein